MNSFNLVLLLLSLIIMCNQVSAGQYCDLRIENRTPLDFNRTKIDSYQMYPWYCDESIPKNSTSYCYMNPSSNPLIDHSKTGSNVYYKSSNKIYDLHVFLDTTGQKLFINSEFKINGNPIDIVRDIPYPYWKLGQRCTFILHFKLTENGGIEKQFYSDIRGGL